MPAIQASFSLSCCECGKHRLLEVGGILILEPAGLYTLFKTHRDVFKEARQTGWIFDGYHDGVCCSRVCWDKHFPGERGQYPVSSVLPYAGPESEK